MLTFNDTVLFCYGVPIDYVWERYRIVSVDMIDGIVDLTWIRVVDGDYETVADSLENLKSRKLAFQKLSRLNDYI